ncbi:Arc family DNA-binding protein [Cereibacter azotoformans]|uniref:Arc family DNA-binding protein n=1 Tax=Cereibacter azotoformans TaxID=43057 RepID=UPI003B215103
MMVRMPAALRDRIKAAADANGRSQNSELIATLSAAYPADAPDSLELLEDFETAMRQGRALVKAIEPTSRTFAELLAQNMHLLSVVAREAGVDLDNPRIEVKSAAQRDEG